VARFESERQALALMEHPNIAKIFDAGATPQGRPYFVMEYVTGIPITEYCDKHRMTLRERPGAFRSRLRRCAACTPESRHPSRSEAIQHSGG
jgi:serine/threonine protein kinase